VQDGGFAIRSPKEQLVILFQLAGYDWLNRSSQSSVLFGRKKKQKSPGLDTGALPF
jgi:hypothetical protein